MKKIWLGGLAFQLTDEQHAEMEAELKAQLIPPYGTGKRSVRDSEQIALDWCADNDIKSVGQAPAENSSHGLQAKGKGKGKAVDVVIVLIGAAAALIDYFLFNSHDVLFAQIIIPALTTGAGVNTVSPAQTQVESDIMIGDIDTTQPLQGLKVNVDGDTTIDVQGSQPLISVLSKLSQFLTGAVVGMLLKIATGRVICKAAVITFTNNGATTPTVYWNSQQGQSKPGRLIRARTTTVNPNSNQTFNRGEFAYLAMTNPANITSIDFTFADGTQQNMAIVEVDGLFAKSNETEANGRLDALVTCVDNTRGNIQSVKINVGATAITVMTVI